MTTTTGHPGQTRDALRRAIVDRIAQELFHAEVLDGLTERSATWEGTTDADREHYRGYARAALRRMEPIALDVAGHLAHQAAERALAAPLTDIGRQALNRAVDEAVAAHYAHLSFGRPEQDERIFEQVHQIPAERNFTAVEGGK
jgi:hypothetical protein